MEVKVRADCTEQKIRNFWNHIHFHPTDAVTDDWGRYILDRVSRDGAARYIRIYAMLEDVVSRDEAGKLTYDFRETDERIDYLTEKGFRLLICFNFLPRAIAANPECMSWLARYKGKHINTSKPAYYQEWQEICRVYTEHLKERYGEDRLSEWYFHCWNEPDFPDYFLSDVPRGGHGAPAAPRVEAVLDSKMDIALAPGTGVALDPAGITPEPGADGGADSAENRNMDRAEEEYEKLYDHFAEGVTAACGRVKIGGPSAALSNRFIEKFLWHVKEGTNRANGGKGTRFDFLSIHTYGAFPKDLEAGKPFRIEDTYKRVKELEALARDCGFAEPEIVVDEWGLSTEGFTDAEKRPVLEFRNTEFYAAAYARLIDYYTRNRAPVKMQMICLSGQHNLKREFHGYRSFFTLHGFPKPIYNAYAMCAKLGDRLLESEICAAGDDSFRKNEADKSGWRNLSESVTGVFPTANNRSRISILLYRFSPSAVNEVQKLRGRTAEPVHLEVSGLLGTYRIRHFRIDHENANSYTAWLELGGRNDLDQTSMEWIRKAGKLKEWYPEETAELRGKWRQDIVMTDNSVSLIELEPAGVV